MSNSIAIAHVTIQQDAEGRYCLNDLHKASGGVKHHRPSKWLATKQAQSLIAEINLEARIRASNSDEVRPEFGPHHEAITSKKDGPFELRGTYIDKELVYAYAMWISPAFHLQVIRAYDALVNERLTKPFTQSENYWFRIRPHWQPIRDLALQGKTYGEIAALVQRSVGSVRRAVKRMVEVGLINPAILAQVQKGIAKLHNLKRSQLWGQQLPLFG